MSPFQSLCSLLVQPNHSFRMLSHMLSKIAFLPIILAFRSQVNFLSQAPSLPSQPLVTWLVTGPQPVPLVQNCLLGNRICTSCGKQLTRECTNHFPCGLHKAPRAQLSVSNSRPSMSKTTCVTASQCTGCH